MVSDNPSKNTGTEPVSAGAFSAWLRRFREALDQDTGIDVPCGTCTACCRSSFFIHVGPGETRTLARIPKKLLFRAPGLPKGFRVMGYDENGSCPMFADDRCSIYEDRPLTCRQFDCRIYPASGIEPDGDADSPLIRRTRAWRFDDPAPEDRNAHRAVRAAAGFLRNHPDWFPRGFIPANPARLAVLAIRAGEVFLEPGATERPPRELAEAVVSRVTRTKGQEK